MIADSWPAACSVRYHTLLVDSLGSSLVEMAAATVIRMVPTNGG